MAPDRAGVRKRIIGYLNALQAVIGSTRNSAVRVYLKEGTRYVRVVVWDGSQNMAHSFVDKTNGNVLKARSWKGPTLKHPRSNVFDDDFGLSGVNQYGANYIK